MRPEVEKWVKSTASNSKIAPNSGSPARFVVARFKNNPAQYRDEDLFSVSLGLEQIRKELEALGVEAHWTMTAAAHDYRETLPVSVVASSMNELAPSVFTRKRPFVSMISSFGQCW